MFKKVLIANRGEIALRIVRSCREMGIKTVAVYSTADKDCLHAKLADESVCIGPPQSASSYLNMPNVIAAAELTNADAIHPGYGFLAENAKFAQVCENHKIAFIGPRSECIGQMGDKITAKTIAKRANVPTVPSGEGLLKNVDEAKRIAHEIGYPVILKATAGGGGRGMRIVWKEADMENSLMLVKTEAVAAFKNDGVYVEKYVEDPRHIEIQIAGDKHGTVCHFSERDCSIQRRHQKLVEESPSPFITPELRQKMGEAALRLAREIQYDSVGTVEFLVDKDRNFYFIEINTRIQVEHCVTEEVTGLDLIREQVKIAAGHKILGQNYEPKFHAIECRINAEDPYNQFSPSPGRISFMYKPGGRGVRIDSHVYSGYTVPPYYDSLIAKIITVAITRDEAIATMRRALEEYVIEGIKTTIPFHLQLMDNKKFRKGDFSTKFLDTFTMKK